MKPMKICTLLIMTMGIKFYILEAAKNGELLRTKKKERMLIHKRTYSKGISAEWWKSLPVRHIAGSPRHTLDNCHAYRYAGLMYTILYLISVHECTCMSTLHLAAYCLQLYTVWSTLHVMQYTYIRIHKDESWTDTKIRRMFVSQGINIFCLIYLPLHRPSKYIVYIDTYATVSIQQRHITTISILL